MKVRGEVIGELEEGELTSGNESDGSSDKITNRRRRNSDYDAVIPGALVLNQKKKKDYDAVIPDVLILNQKKRKESIIQKKEPVIRKTSHYSLEKEPISRATSQNSHYSLEKEPFSRAISQKKEPISRKTSHYEPTPPRGYRTSAGQRLRDRWKRRSPPTDTLKFKYHGTMDLVRKTSNSSSSAYPSNALWRHPGGSPGPSPSRKPEMSENTHPGNATSNIRNSERTGRKSPNLKDLVLKPMRKKLGILEKIDLYKR